MTFFGHDGGNIARIHLDAACTLIDTRAGTSETYYLIAPCRAELMYRDTTLLQMPNYEFCGIFAADECLLIRTHWRSDRDNREYGRNRERFAAMHLDIRMHAQARPLLTATEIVAATLANFPLIARTTVHDAARGQTAIIEYPVKTMNVLPKEDRFQVDTGPVLLPDFAATTAREIERFDMTYVLYHQFTQAEFILRRPVAPNGGSAALSESVTDYSVVRAVEARNELFAIGMEEG